MPSNSPVTLFAQCLVDAFAPEVGEAMLTLFGRLGIEVVCPSDHTCCGQPAFNSGYRREARIAAERFLRLFGDAGTIVCPSGSCVNMVRHHYPELFPHEKSWLKLAGRVAYRSNTEEREALSAPRSGSGRSRTCCGSWRQRRETSWPASPP